MLRKAGKGKDYSDANNWRGICLAKMPAKIQSSIISSRLLSHLEKVGIDTQYGCMPGKDYTDALSVIKTALQTRKQNGKTPGQSLLIWWSKRLTLLTTNSYS
eukprot:scaffold201541_cov24-Attheya_sp.AAC.1